MRPFLAYYRYMKLRLLIPALLFAFPVASASASSLRGSHASMVRQNQIAKKNDFTFLRSATQIREFAVENRLEELRDTDTFLLAGVSFPYARPVVRLFVERLAEQYRDATGSALVITSLTRPTSRQPRNASPLSVHPAGMAVDFRIPADAAARNWLEHALLDLEDRGLLDVTRETHPSHYHVAVFPDAYEAYAARMTIETAQLAANAARFAQMASAATATASDSLLPLAASMFAALCGLFVLAGFRLRRAFVSAN